MQMWLVKLKPETSQQFLTDTNQFDEHVFSQALNGIYHHATVNDSGLYDHARLNPKYFDIKAYRKCTLQNIMQETEVDEDVNVTAPQNVRKFIRINQRCSTTIENVMGAEPTQPAVPPPSWKNMTTMQVMPNDRYYLLTHVGGYASPANQLKITANWITTVKTDI
jgi:hypothetical protein